MTNRLSRARFVLGAIAITFLVAFAAPAHAQQNAPVDPDASVVNERTLLQMYRGVEGLIDQPNTREQVLIQPAGRVWDHFHEVTLRWIGAIVILGTLAGLAAAYLILGRLRVSAGRSGRKVPRFTSFERFSHWLTAVSFVVLVLTRLKISFGKVLLRPLLGT